jgi:hypothetical protein
MENKMTDLSPKNVAEVSDRLMMTARVGNNSYENSKLMDDASILIEALQARIVALELALKGE